MLQWGISAGTIGKASLGEWMQNTYHHLIDIKQLLGLDLGLSIEKCRSGSIFTQPMQKHCYPANASFIQITPVTQATLGSFFTNATEGVLLQMGKINSQSESAYWDAAMQENANKLINPELFFYYYPATDLAIVQCHRARRFIQKR